MCEAFLCEQYVYRGYLSATANVTYLRFAGRRYRLYFDCGLVFWRERLEAEMPTSWAVPAEGVEYPIVDVGSEAGVVGTPLRDYDMEATGAGTRVTFAFENGVQILVCSASGRMDYAIS